MPAKLTTYAVEKSSIVIEVSFKNEAGKPLTPNTVKWTLYDKSTKAVVNDREQVSETPAPTVNILLEGADLAILSGKGRETRELVIEATYDSEYGSDIPLKGSLEFEVVNLHYIT